MTRIVIGPFRQDEVPRLTTRLEHVEPKDSLICHKVRVDDAEGYKLVYNIQNYGIKTVRVVVRRIG